MQRGKSGARVLGALATATAAGVAMLGLMAAIVAAAGTNEASGGMSEADAQALIEKMIAEQSGQTGIVKKIEEPVQNDPTTNDWVVARKKMDIRGVMSGPGGYAIVNGKVVEPGAIVTVAYSNWVFRWKVKAITTGGLDFSEVNAISKEQVEKR